MWGQGTTDLDWFDDLLALTGVKEFIFGGNVDDTFGVYYITASGFIGHVGDVFQGTSYPTNSGFTKLYEYESGMLAENEDGSVYWWNNQPASGTLSGVEAPLLHCVPSPVKDLTSTYNMSINYHCIVDKNGISSQWKMNSGSGPTATATYLPPVNEGIIASCSGAGGHMVCYSDLTWWGYNESVDTFTDIPALLNPTFVRCFNLNHGCLAINEDGTVVGWGEDEDNIIADIPYLLKAHQLGVSYLLAGGTYYQFTAFAIKKDEE
jgi:hypothetical protein